MAADYRVSPVPNLNTPLSKRTAFRDGTILCERYQIQQKMANCAFGTLYQALDTKLQKKVLIKVLESGLVSGGKSSELFWSQAKTTIQLSHPNVIDTLDVTGEGPNHFFVMEYIEGRPLQELLSSHQALPFELIKNIVLQLCDALIYVHKTTSHRALRPDNIWLCSDGRIKLMDVGLANMLRPGKISQTAISFGFEDYLAPEQKQSHQQIDQQVDQYALGILIYQLLFNHSPNELDAHDWRSRKEIPKHFQKAVQRTLKINPQARYPSIALFKSDIAFAKAKKNASKQLLRATLLLILLSVIGLGSFRYLTQLDFQQWLADDPAPPLPATIENQTQIDLNAVQNPSLKQLIELKLTLEQVQQTLVKQLVEVRAEIFRISQQLTEVPAHQKITLQRELNKTNLFLAQNERILEHQNEYFISDAELSQFNQLIASDQNANIEQVHALIGTFTQKLANIINIQDMFKAQRQAYFWQKKWQPFQSELTEPSSLFVRLKQAQDLQQKGQIKQADEQYQYVASTYEKLVAAAPQLIKRNKQAQQIAQQWQELSTNYPIGAKNQVQLDTLWQRAQDAMEQNDYQQATEVYEHITRLLRSLINNAEEVLANQRSYQNFLHVLSKEQIFKIRESNPTIDLLEAQIPNRLMIAPQSQNNQYPYERLIVLYKNAMQQLNIAPKVHISQTETTATSVNKPVEAATAPQPQLDTQTLLQQLNADMQTIQGGAFFMGAESNSNNASPSYYSPQHKVTVATFKLSRYEISFEQYDVFAQATGYKQPDDNNWGRGNRPVMNISWIDALQFINWLNQQSTQKFRLPTEAEWEYVAWNRKNNRTAYKRSFPLSSLNCRGCIGQPQALSTMPINSYAPNEWNIHNLFGNVAEWTQDCWNKNYFNASETALARNDGDCSKRVVRGGAWNTPVNQIAPFQRSYFDQTHATDWIGFRLAQDLSL